MMDSLPQAYHQDGTGEPSHSLSDSSAYGSGYPVLQSGRERWEQNNILPELGGLFPHTAGTEDQSPFIGTACLPAGTGNIEIPHEGAAQPPEYLPLMSRPTTGQLPDSSILGSAGGLNLPENFGDNDDKEPAYLPSPQDAQTDQPPVTTDWIAHPPSPTHLKRYHERAVFQTEQQVLAAVSELISTVDATPDASIYELRNALADLSSDEIAEETLYAYGMIDGRSHDTHEVAIRYHPANQDDIDPHTISIPRQAAIQALLFEYGNRFEPELRETIRTTLSDRYMLNPAMAEGKAGLRAAGNWNYYQDRKFIRAQMAKDSRMKKIFIAFYGEADWDLFCRYYRLEGYAKQPNLTEQQGVFTGPIDFRMTDALEGGWAVAEFSAGLEHGSRTWTRTKGPERAGFTKGRRGDKFPEVYKTYEPILTAIDLIDSGKSAAELTPLESDLLRLMIRGVRTKHALMNEALRQFNTAHSSHYSMHYAHDLASRIAAKAINGTSFDNFKLLRKAETAREILQNESGQSSLVRMAIEIAQNYYIHGNQTAEIAKSLNIQERYISALIHTMGRLVKSYPGHITVFPTRTDITVEEINAFAENPRFINWLIGIVKDIAEGKSSLEVALSLEEENVHPTTLKRTQFAADAVFKLIEKISARTN